MNPLSDAELIDLILLLQKHTAVNRLGLAEVRTMLRFMEEAGYSIGKPAAEAA